MIPVILSGGSGTRLWPVSRQSFPKQFCELLEESLFAKTVKRLRPLGSPWVITTKSMKTLTDRGLKELELPTDQVIYEPMGKNTAPAVALACRVFELAGKGDEVIGIFPADHLIDNEDEFLRVVRSAEALAKKGHVVTLGIHPTHPATGYGYIETSSAFEGDSVARKAIGFREKPNQETARDFLHRGGFYWNAGMFIFRVNAMIELFKKHAPDIWNEVSAIKADRTNLEEIYGKVRATSIDYALMERLPSHVCIPYTAGWNDLGSWDSIADVLPRKSDQMHSISVESDDNFVFPYGDKTYALVGVEDLVVVDTVDALLVAKRGQTELVKEAIDQLKAVGNARVVEHKFEVRPWGRFEVLRDESNYKSKVISVDPGSQISYQSHTKRSEHWIIVSGEGEVVLDGVTQKIGPSSHVHIPAGAKHRIRNTGNLPLNFVEVQTGTYFGEDDIFRYDDVYGRS